VAQVGAFLLGLFLSLPSAMTADIEKAFLQNDARWLLASLPAGRPVSVALPEPIAFSDQIGREQAYFLFSKIFRTYSTFEFFPEPNMYVAVSGGRILFKARWSFLDRSERQFVFETYFYLLRRDDGAGRIAWELAEIKADRL
jgi:hypothetical protein